MKRKNTAEKVHLKSGGEDAEQVGDARAVPEKPLVVTGEA